LEIPRERWWAYADGTYWEKDVLPALEGALATLGDQVIFWDVGANCGHYVVALAPRVRSVYAFEPIRSTFEVLERNIVRNDLSNVDPLRVALGESEGPAIFNLFESSGKSSAFAASGVQGQEEVVVRTVDGLVDDGVVLPPGLIKIDTEGGELSVLRGARRVLNDLSPIVVLEFHREESAIAGYSLGDLVRELSASSYSVSTLPDGNDPMKSGAYYSGALLATPRSV
jgi:FkbM family methyltransferase